METIITMKARLHKSFHSSTALLKKVFLKPEQPKTLEEPVITTVSDLFEPLVEEGAPAEQPVAAVVVSVVTSPSLLERIKKLPFIAPVLERRSVVFDDPNRLDAHQRVKRYDSAMTSSSRALLAAAEGKKGR